MAAILARFKSEMGDIVTYFTTFSTLMTSISGGIAEFVNGAASISGQYTDLLTNTSGLWKTKYDLNNP